MQQFDEIINCPKSGGDLCYKVEVTPEVTNYFSMSCGFWTNSLMKADSDFYKEQLITLPELYKDLAWIDLNTELIWLPNHINIQESGMVFAYGTTVDDWQWAAVKAKKLDKPETTKDGKTIEYKPDMNSMKLFTERDYMDALSYIGVLPE